jgi:hypothetical protein
MKNKKSRVKNAIFTATRNQSYCTPNPLTTSRPLRLSFSPPIALTTTFHLSHSPSATINLNPSLSKQCISIALTSANSIPLVLAQYRLLNLSSFSHFCAKTTDMQSTRYSERRDITSRDRVTERRRVMYNKDEEEGCHSDACFADEGVDAVSEG